ncbi:MAG: hypothetical protein ACI8R9_002294 [Paraglaciecola sp.]|jgi:hypothetical protein
MSKFIIILSFFISSCTFNTNLGSYVKKKIHNDIRSSTVYVYNRNEIWNLKTINLGRVETNYCQNEKFGNLPSERELNKVLRSKTQKLGGNGIVYDSCESGRNYMNCELYIRCQGAAYIVEH